MTGPARDYLRPPQTSDTFFRTEKFSYAETCEVCKVVILVAITFKTSFSSNLQM